MHFHENPPETLFGQCPSRDVLLAPAEVLEERDEPSLTPLGN